MPSTRSDHSPRPFPGQGASRHSEALSRGVSWILVLGGIGLSALMGAVWLLLGVLAGWVMSLPHFSSWPFRPAGDYAILVVPYVLLWGAVAALVARLAGLRRVAVALAFAPGVYTALALAWFIAAAFMHG